MPLGPATLSWQMKLFAPLSDLDAYFKRLNQSKISMGISAGLVLYVCLMGMIYFYIDSDIPCPLNSILFYVIIVL